MRTALLVGSLSVALLVAGPAPASPRSVSAGASTSAWCAEVIRINTKFGTMKNKTYVPQNQVSNKTRIALFEYALAHRNQLLSITPAVIKTAQAHELAFFARLKANHYSPTTPLAPMTIADVKQLSAFQRTKCGIKGI